MANIHDFHSSIDEQQKALERISRFDGGDGGDYDARMEARVAKLEDFVVDARERLTKIETRLDQTATKADLHEMSGSLIKWVVGTAIVLGATALTVMTFVLNNATPKAAATSPAPIVIQIPSQSMTPPPAPASAK